MSDRAESALALLRYGWNVVAAAPRGKLPVGAWRRYQKERVTEREIAESFSHGDPNFFIITGSVSRLCVLDCDTPEADAWWRERLGGEVLDATTQVSTTRGRHYYFRLAEGQVERGRSRHEGDIEWDLRAEGNGVIAPPSVHSSGTVYTWAPERGPESLQDAPPGLFHLNPETGDEGPQTRSLLSHLLSNPPEEGGRNVWLAKVAGHYALHIPHEDAYETLVRQAAAQLSPSLPEHEIEKLLKSIWGAERAKLGKAAEPVEEGDDWRENLQEASADTGWLVSGGNRVLVQVRRKIDGEAQLSLDAWMDADVRVTGIVEGESSRTYQVELRHPDGRVTLDALPAEWAASAQRLPVWLARHGVSIGGPDDMWPGKMRETTRLIRYMEAQKAPSMEAVPYLGWHDGSQAFITHEGLIRADGPGDFEGVRPHPAMRNWAKYRYGVVESATARDVLARVLEFHDETVASVFGAWWAAALLKPQLQRSVSQFPFMALEAASESGKTTGYFNLMMQLSGHYGGQTNPTPAALRDALSANRSGIVWVDDLDDLAHHGELLRNVTVGGSLVKKGENNHDQITATMRASLVVSGEGLGLHGQKALLDRAVLLNVPSPVGRLNRSGRPQWEDVLELARAYPDLTQLAGTVVQLALREAHQAEDLKSLRTGSGRFADKVAVIRLGARILSAMTRENWIVEHVDAWAQGQQDPGAENALTLTVIPEVLAVIGKKQRPEGPDEARRMVPTPVFVEGAASDEPTVWFSPLLLEQWLRRNRRQGSLRLETKQALEDQARALGLGGRRGIDRKQWRYATGEGKSVYWRCPHDLSKELLARSEGLDAGGEDDGREEVRQPELGDE